MEVPDDTSSKESSRADEARGFHNGRQRRRWQNGVMVALAEWFAANDIPVTLLDLDTENKARGSLKHFFNGSVTKVNIHIPAGLDAFVDHLISGLRSFWPTWELVPDRWQRTGSRVCMKM